MQIIMVWISRLDIRIHTVNIVVIPPSRVVDEIVRLKTTCWQNARVGPLQRVRVMAVDDNSISQIESDRISVKSNIWCLQKTRMWHTPAYLQLQSMDSPLEHLFTV